MTCIVGYLDEENAYIGADQLIVDGAGGKFELDKSNSKIYSNGSVICGFAGDRHIQNQLLIDSTLQSVNDKDDKSINDLWVRFCQVQKEYNLLATYNFGRSSSLILSAGNHLVQMTTIGGWSRLEGKFFSMGSGGQFAFGALEILNALSDFSTEDKIKHALWASFRRCPSVGELPIIEKIPRIK